MLRKYVKVLFATIYLAIVLTLNHFYELKNTSLAILFVIYIGLLWTYDIIKLKIDGREEEYEVKVKR